MTDATPDKKRLDAGLVTTPVQILAQYVKDFSFENPGAPGTLRVSNARPEMDVNLVLDAIKIEDEANPDLYESVLTLKVKSTRESETLFIAEISYAALVGVRGIGAQHIKPILYIDVPHMLFPFARQMIATAVSAGGFPPLLLAPVDFRGMYEKSHRDGAERGQAA